MTIDNIPFLNAKKLLREHGLRPNRHLGQHFLTDPTALRHVAEAGDVGAADTVLEIGAGLGNLTRYLATQSGRVVAVEIDERLIPPLKKVLTPFDNVTIVQGDILTLNPNELFKQYATLRLRSEPALELPKGQVRNKQYLVIANIPYNITSTLIRHLLEGEQPPARFVLTVQKEVAQRIYATSGRMSLLALSVQVYGKPEIVGKISAGAFYPTPKVDSAILRVDLYPRPRIPKDCLDTFFRLSKAGFSQKRKTLRNALSGGMRWSKEKTVSRLRAAGIAPMRRAETLSLDEWEALVDLTSNLGD